MIVSHPTPAPAGAPTSPHCIDGKPVAITHCETPSPAMPAHVAPAAAETPIQKDTTMSHEGITASTPTVITGHGDGMGLGSGGFLTGALLASGGLFGGHRGHGHDGCAPKRDCLDTMITARNEGRLEGISQRLNANETEDTIRDAAAGVRDKLSEVRAGVVEKIDCVKHDIHDVKANQRDLARELCDIRGNVKEGFATVIGEIRTQAYESRLRESDGRERDLRDKLESERFRRLRDEVRDECGREYRSGFRDLSDRIERSSQSGNTGGIGSNNSTVDAAYYINIGRQAALVQNKG